MNFENQAETWIRHDPMRMEALVAASALDLEDWCIAAGFVRNLVWDRLHRKQPLTPLNDVDLIYFDPGNTARESDLSFEKQLGSISALPWSVKNQARMHLRNNDQPYTSTSDAMSYWVEMETAVGVRLLPQGDIEFIAPFGLARLFGNSITINNKRTKTDEFHARIESKQWLVRWPKLVVSA